eukprot:Ihof_evm1s1143 gene=Ihof_evmTU1s1143
MSHVDELDRQVREIQAKRKQANNNAEEGVGFGKAGNLDTDIYGGSNRFEGFVQELREEDDDDDDSAAAESVLTGGKRSYTAPKELLKPVGDDDEDPFKQHQVNNRIADREDEYHARRRNRIISPERHDPFAGGVTPDTRNVRTYTDIMHEQQINRDSEQVKKKIAEKIEEASKTGVPLITEEPKKRRRRFDQAPEVATPTTTTEWDSAEVQSTPSNSKWDSTPGRVAGVTPARKRNRWDATPQQATGGETPGGAWGATPTSASEGETPRKKSRWDKTPVGGDMGATPVGQAFGQTPVGSVAMGLQTPTPGMMMGALTPDQVAAQRWASDIDDRNRPVSDEELDAMFPTEGYKILEIPSTYQPIRTPSRKLLATPTPMGDSGGFFLQEDNIASGAQTAKDFGLDGGPTNLPALKPEDQQYFGKLLVDVN